MKSKKHSKRPLPIMGVKSQNLRAKDWAQLPKVCFVDIQASIISNEIVKDGTVLLFLERSPKDFVSLPMRFFVTKKYTATIDSQWTFKKVRLMWTNILEGDTAVPKSFKIKVITLPSGVREKFPDLEMRSFPAVANAFNIGY